MGRDAERALQHLHLSIKPIVHCAMGLRFGKVCERKREKKREKNATSSCFYPANSVI